MADFKQAIEWMKGGKKVTMWSEDDPDEYIFSKNNYIGEIYDESNERFNPTLAMLISEDWEIYDEDTWNYVSKFNELMNKDFTDSRRYKPLQEELKQTIIQDLDKDETIDGLQFSKFKRVLDKRFGF